MDVPSKCTIVRTMGRSAYRLQGCPVEEIGARTTQYRIDWYISPTYAIGPPPFIRPVLLLDLVAKGT
jgi:hypothetical protein